MPRTNSHTSKMMIAIAFAAIILIGERAMAAEIPASQLLLTPVELFHRCYRTLVRKPAPKDHPILLKVKSGQLPPAQGCLEILNLATLNPNGTLVNDTPESRSILNTVNDFHRGWFPSDDYSQGLDNGDFFFNNGYIYDPGSAALYFTRALLVKDLPYSSVVLDTNYYNPLRDKFPPTPTYPINGVARFISRLDFQFAPMFWSSPLFQEFGEFYGTKQVNGTLDGEYTLPSALYVNHPYKVFDYFGGGFLGTQAYLLLNFGRHFNEVSDGGFSLPRRLSQSIFRDALCREIPVIRAEDSKKLVEPDSKLPFRTQASCMQCHGSIDTMAGAARNFQILLSYPSDFNREIAPASMYMNPVGGGTAFHQQEPTGVFRFRSYDGTLIEKDITGMKGIGEALAETSDLYVCAARRYVEFFTGLRVNLDDIGDSDRQPLTPSEKRYREKVIELGIALGAHQDLRTMLRSFWESELFQKASMREFIRVD